MPTREEMQKRKHDRVIEKAAKTVAREAKRQTRAIALTKTPELEVRDSNFWMGEALRWKARCEQRGRLLDRIDPGWRMRYPED